MTAEGLLSTHLGRSPQLSRLVSCAPGSGYAAYFDDVGRAFRLMSATHSERSRPAVPIDVGRGGGAPAGRM
jgi:hypothetical protein